MFFTLFCAGTYVTQVTATDADDPTYGNSARVVYSILHGQPYFSVDPKTGTLHAFHLSYALMMECDNTIRIWKQVALFNLFEGNFVPVHHIGILLFTYCLSK